MNNGEKVLTGIAVIGVLATATMTLDVSWIYLVRGIVALIGVAALYLRLQLRNDEEVFLNAALTLLILTPFVAIEPVALVTFPLALGLFLYHIWQGRVPSWGEQLDMLTWRINDGDNASYRAQMDDVWRTRKADDARINDLLAQFGKWLEERPQSADQLKGLWPIKVQTDMPEKLNRMNRLADLLRLAPAPRRTGTGAYRALRLTYIRKSEERRGDASPAQAPQP